MSVRELFQTMTYGTAPEAADAARAWLDAHKRKFDLFPGLTLTQNRVGIGPHPTGEYAPYCYFAPNSSQMFSHADIADNAPLFPGSSDRVATIAVFGLDL